MNTTHRLSAVTLAAALAIVPARAGYIMVPYVDRMPDGTTIDWLAGKASTVGLTRIVHDIDKQKGYFEQTKNLAEIDGRARLLAALGEVSVDGKARLKEVPRALEQIATTLEPLHALSVESKRGPMFQATMSIPLWGDAGIMDIVMPGERHDDKGKTGEATTSQPGRGDGAAPQLIRADASSSTPSDVTGLILDASLLPEAAPALLPRVLDESGRLVYGLGPADSDFVRGRGLIGYAQVLESSETTRRPYEREGSRPMSVPVRSLAGPLHTDLVISAADADRILGAAATSRFLLECRVLALLPAPPVRREPAGAHPSPRKANPAPHHAPPVPR
ncbi:MAG TPA: hypothetical protein VFG76_11555 [Candidatus Polarisedimenticolia bacterium]|nr:hypothetical protein [Candidatus Polarisedimenticolia bacterium]